MPQKNQYINIRGARTNNLKNVSIKIPKNQFIVMTGISGSGKSSLAFDTIYAEGQRRYVESLSNYARQFINILDKPDVDQIEGLSPAISIDQKSIPRNPRSTVGTMTEIYDYLKLLFARVGKVHCPDCGHEIKKQTSEQILQKILSFKNKEILLLAPIAKNQKDNCKKILEEIKEAEFEQVILNDSIYPIQKAIDSLGDKIECSISIVINNFSIPKNNPPKEQLSEIIKDLKTALDLGNGLIEILEVKNKKKHVYSQNFICTKCGVNISEIEPRIFSFNSPYGACEECSGLGIKQEIDPELTIPNKNLSIAQGAIRPLIKTHSNGNKMLNVLEQIAQKHNFSINTPVKDLNKKQLNVVFYGSTAKNDGLINREFTGVIDILNKKYKQTDSNYTKNEIEQYMRTFICPKCNGARLKKQALSVYIDKKDISVIVNLDIEKAIKFFNTLKLNKEDQNIANQIIKEIIERLMFLSHIGLGYLTLDRSANTLSGGEAQRIKLATQIGSQLSGVLYVLDEPSIGLHQQDNQKLISTIKDLRDLENTVVVVEHDPETILSADWIVDIGPGAGNQGGKIISQGTAKQIQSDKNSLTGRYLSGKEQISLPKKYRKGNNKYIQIKKADEFNLQNIDVKFPLNTLTCVTGVSGSGKSTLITNILSKALSKHFYRSKEQPGKHKEIIGLENINKVITIDQSPIGKTPRSNPATYTGVFTLIRDLFTETPEAKMRGLSAGHFSFNVPGGRCENCQGDGVIKIEMNFMQDVYIECESCQGKRYNREILEVHYKEKNIAGILDMSVEEAMVFFEDQPPIHNKLKILFDVGLGYIKLGQSANKLSGGEAQRVKLATELSRRDTGKTLYILDEPTTGLHFQDIKNLLIVLNRLVDKGNTVIVIEHNLDIIKTSDWIIDLGPGGGDKGGQVVVQGTPQNVAKSKKGYTGKFLKKVLK
jgi:excinuclease ABC subunit A